MTASSDSIHEGCILTGALFNEPMRVETARTSNDGTWTVGLVGTHTERFRKVTLTNQDIKGLTILDSGFTFDGDGHLLRLGLQAYSLGIAWEFDPYFGLSISRVDPLPHQLEAIYDYLLKLDEAHRMSWTPPARKTARYALGELLRDTSDNILLLTATPHTVDFQIDGPEFDLYREITRGYDVTSLGLNSGELRLIEVKGLSAATGTILLTPNERRVAEDRRDCYWLYVVTNCATHPIMQEPIKDPARFPWQEVTKVAHYWLEVNAMTRPMMVREDSAPYGREKP